MSALLRRAADWLHALADVMDGPAQDPFADGWPELYPPHERVFELRTRIHVGY